MFSLARLGDLEPPQHLASHAPPVKEFECDWAPRFVRGMGARGDQAALVDDDAAEGAAQRFSLIGKRFSVWRRPDSYNAGREPGVCLLHFAFQGFRPVGREQADRFDRVDRGL